MEITLTHLGFWLSSAQNCRKCAFLDNLRTIIQEGSMKTRQMTPFYLVFLLQLLVTFIFIFENSQNRFYCGPPPLWSILLCKIP